MAESWRNRIIGSGEEDPEQLLANPRNFRTHPGPQRDAMRGILDRVGWVTGVVVNQRTGYVVDGHLRIEEALSRHEPTIPVQYVDLSPEEEGEILLALDPIGAMATADQERLASIIGEIGQAWDESGLTALMEDMRLRADMVGIIGFPALPDGDRGEFRQMTFIVSAAQETAIDSALAKAKAAGEFPDGNENSNGNALARIAEAYV